jgi:NSS family neurotransmitter:Na+ symporter
MIAGWTLAYAWSFIVGSHPGGRSPGDMSLHFRSFVADTPHSIGWHFGFIAIVAVISMRGVNRGVEWISRWRAPVLMVLLLILVGYALLHGDVQRGFRFAFAPNWRELTQHVMLLAIGQAFYAIGVGIGIMLAYGAYMPTEVSVVRTSGVVTLAIVVVSLLATLMIFPLVFRYGLNPAQGPELVFQVLPIAFAKMPSGRLVGALFFVLLAVAALTPSIAGLEPVVALLQQRGTLTRSRAVFTAAIACALVGLVSDLSFGPWSAWQPFATRWFSSVRNPFYFLDYLAASLLAPLAALGLAVFVGWRLRRSEFAAELSTPNMRVCDWFRFSVRYSVSTGDRNGAAVDAVRVC